MEDLSLAFPESSLAQWFHHPVHTFIIIYLLFWILFLFFPPLFFFLPGLSFEVKFTDSGVRLLLGLPLLAGLVHFTLPITALITALCLIASLIATLTDTLLQHERQSYEEIDHLRYLNQEIKDQRERLLALQNDREIQSILEERKRITDEIHDILGHQLSSAIIQLGALEIVEANPTIKTKLGQVRQVLTTGMENVRSVVHAQRDSAVQFDRELKTLVAHFEKCPIQLTYTQNHDMPLYITHSLLNIIKESLTNINKHSNASLVRIKFIEISHHWNLLIADNGIHAMQRARPLAGMGLLNMEERVAQLKGTLSINRENGFRIFISIPIPEESE